MLFYHVHTLLSNKEQTQGSENAKLIGPLLYLILQSHSRLSTVCGNNTMKEAYHGVPEPKMTF